MQNIYHKIFMFTLFSLLVGNLSVFGSDKISKQSIILGEEQIGTKYIYVAKKPDIICKLNSIDFSSISVVMLDDTDITANVKQTQKGFRYKPLLIIPPGEHTLSIVYTINGEENQKDYTFKTRQSKMFEKEQTNINVSATYENIIKKSKSLSGVVWSKGESDIGLKTELGEKKWDYSFETNLRFLDQSASVEAPEIKGINLASYLLSANFNGDDLQLGFKLGDVTADESDYSVQGLGSRGITLNATYGTYELHTFLMDGVQNYGWHGGMGLSARDSDHIYGLSLQKTFLEDTTFKVVYAKGGKLGDGFGTSSDESNSTHRRGDVLGFVFHTPVVKDKLNLTSELDFSSFDQEVGDKFGYENDKAYNIKFDGALSEKYNYSLMYEYIGPKYNSIGADGLENDKSGFSGELSANFSDIHSLDFTLSRYNDNVKNDKTYARIYTTEGALNYTYSKFENIPMSAGWTHTVQKSDNEPSASDVVDTIADSVNANIGYNRDNWNYGLDFEYSRSNDKTAQNDDTISKTVTFTPAYSNEIFHLNPSFAFNRSQSKQDVDVDTITFGLGLGGTVMNEKISYDFASTYEKNRPDQGNDTYTLNLQGQVAYNFVALGSWMDHPIVGIKGAYNNTTASSSSSGNSSDSQFPAGESYSVTLFVSIPLSYSF